MEVDEQQQVSKGTKAKHWAVTINNYVDDDISKFEDIKKFASYWIYAKEIGSSGTRHLQCVICGNKQITLPTLRRWFPRNLFAVPVYKDSTPQQAAEYCKKDGAFTEYGMCPESRNKHGGDATSDLWDVTKELAQEGKLDQISPKIYITHYRNLKQIKFDSNSTPPEITKTCGVWIYGPTRIGKSTRARKEYPDFYEKMINKWWDDYDGEENVLIEDIDPTHDFMALFLKRYMDRFPFRVEVKNHTQMIRPKKIVVTSQYHPMEIFKERDAEAIVARCKMIHMQQLEEVDKTETTKRYVKPTKTKESDIIHKKPRLYRADKMGNISINPNAGKPKKISTLDDQLLKASSQGKTSDTLPDTVPIVQTNQSQEMSSPSSSWECLSCGKDCHDCSC